MLELFLFTERRAKERDLDEIASSIGLDAQTMRSIERGAQSIDSQPALTIAAWAEALGLQRENVRAALVRSFDACTSGHTYAGDAEPQLTLEQRRYIEEVVAALPSEQPKSAG